MLKSTSTETEIKRASNIQPGFASSLLVWIQQVLTSGFGNLGRARTDKRMHLIEILQLGGKRQLMLVKCDGMEYLVGVGGDSVHSIVEMSTRQMKSTESHLIGEVRPHLHQQIKSPCEPCESGWSQ